MFPEEMVPDIDLGDDHYLVFTRWAPDDLPANRKNFKIPDGQPMPVVEKYGAIIRHYRPDGTLCEGAIDFESEWTQKHHALAVKYNREHGLPEPGYQTWTVECWEPLTCSPSLLCKAPAGSGTCGDHGYIRNGKWVRA